MKKLIFTISASALLFSFTITENTKLEESNLTKIEFSKESTKLVEIKITGMTCAGCSNHVTETLNKIEGVSKVSLKFPGDVAKVEYDSNKTTPKAMVSAIEGINYKAEIITK